ncbi:MAG TPA: archaemetzincin family Zn-dependent metalloprotease [Bryobacteraceae bacterium]|nr:archaemetzincin family Zn-dependent metalloprotease [Bryobacteraceae bacterium]
MIHLLGIEVAPEELGRLGVRLPEIFHMECRVRPERLDVAFARDRVRNQYYSTAILQAMQTLAEAGARLLAVTSLDLYVPVLTFVFGEAQLGGSCAVVSMHRLREEFYGLPAREDLMRERLFKEAVHELGHTFGLRHCDDWRCVMTSSHAVERLDVKDVHFCSACGRAVSRDQLYSVGMDQPSPH